MKRGDFPKVVALIPGIGLLSGASGSGGEIRRRSGAMMVFPDGRRLPYDGPPIVAGNSFTWPEEIIQAMDHRAAPYIEDWRSCEVWARGQKLNCVCCADPTAPSLEVWSEYTDERGYEPPHIDAPVTDYFLGSGGVETYTFRVPFEIRWTDGSRLISARP